MEWGKLGARGGSLAFKYEKDVRMQFTENEEPGPSEQGVRGEEGKMGDGPNYIPPKFICWGLHPQLPHSVSLFGDEVFKG